MQDVVHVNEAPKSQGYFVALDGLRLLCCTMVIVGHAGVGHPWMRFASKLSGMGVNIFFALSGFLITTLLLREHEKHGRIDLRSFYLRRVLRIFPVYYVALASSVLGIVVLGQRYSRPFGVDVSELRVGKILLSHLFFTANWVEQALPTSLDVLWSVCVEEQFYLIFPCAIAMMSGRMLALVPALVGLAIAWASRAWLVRVDPSAIYRNTFAHGDHLLLGALAAQWLHSAPKIVHRVASRVRPFGELVVLGLIGAVLAWETAAPPVGLALWFNYLVSAVLAVALVVLIAIGDGPVARLFSREWPSKLGQMTYAGYVFHMYAVVVAWFVCARITPNVLIAAPLRMLIAIPLTFVIAYIVRVAFEARMLALKDRWGRVKP